MSKKFTIRQRKRFGNWRKFSGISLAALSTAAVIAAMGAFRYEYRQSQEKEQTASIIRLDPEFNYRLFEMLDRHDPARTFGVTGGSFGELLPQKKYGVDLEIGTLPPLAVKKEAVSDTVIPVENIPVSSRYAGVLPAGAKVKKVPLRTQVTAQDGRVINLAALEKLTGKPTAVKSAVKISGSGALLRVATVHSSGDKELDRKAELVLKSAGLSSGIYLITWYAKAGER